MIEELSGDFFQQLRGFYYTAQTGSVRKAAHFMNRNPSTISWQIRQLEQALNTVLFDRYRKSLHITPEGQRLLEWTISTFELLRGMKSDISSPSGILRGTVSISSNLPFSAQVVGLISVFRKTHPEVRIKVRRALTYEVVDDVASSRVDFGLTGMTAEAPNCDLEELFTSRPLLIAPRDNDYRLPEHPTAEDIADLLDQKKESVDQILRLTGENPDMDSTAVAKLVLNQGTDPCRSVGFSGLASESEAFKYSY